MNILQVNTVYPQGSTGRICDALATAAAAQDDMQAFAAYGAGTPVQSAQVHTVCIGKPLERKWHGALRKLLDGEGYGSYLATGKLIRFCKTHAIDVIHLHNLHGCYIHLKRWFTYLRQSGVPVIWTLHDCWPMTGHCAHFDFASCEKWKTQCFQCPEQNSYPQNLGPDGSRRNYRLKKRLFSDLPNLTVVSPCRWLDELAKQSYLQNASFRVIYNGVDTAAFYPETSALRKRYGLAQQKVILAAASVWTERKGLLTLAKLAEKMPQNYTLVVLGLTPQQIKALPAGILGLTRTADQETLRTWHSTADCFVNPTLEDTMPLVNLEAVACGTPVVTFDTGGCAEAITEACGRVVNQGDLEGLVHAMREICEAEYDYTAACRAQAEAFAAQHMKDAYVALYREVLS